jgi:hypothetical protein
MPKKHSRRSMKGGFDFGSFTNSLSNSLSGVTTSLKNSTASLGDKFKKSVPSFGSTSPVPATSYTPSVGGRKRRSMRGGDFTDNTPTTGLAFHAAPFSGETARPNTIVGGKTRKRRKHHKRSKSHRRR